MRNIPDELSEKMSAMYSIVSSIEEEGPDDIEQSDINRLVSAHDELNDAILKFIDEVNADKKVVVSD